MPIDHQAHRNLACQRARHASGGVFDARVKGIRNQIGEPITKELLLAAVEEVYALHLDAETRRKRAWVRSVCARYAREHWGT